MVTKKVSQTDRAYLKVIGRRVARIILEERGYSSLDAFALENSDLISKPTLYDLCAGRRDMKLTTLRGLAEALETTVSDLTAETKTR
jgi:Cro/C1-type HTH DNA-binding domain